MLCRCVGIADAQWQQVYGTILVREVHFANEYNIWAIGIDNQVYRREGRTADVLANTGMNNVNKNILREKKHTQTGWQSSVHPRCAPPMRHSNVQCANSTH